MLEVRCSSLARPMVCAGYVFMEVEETDQDTDAADEGTAAGEYLQAILEQKPIGHTASNGVFFDDDIKFYTTQTAANIYERAVGPVLCEQRIDWMTRAGIKIRGSYDIAFVDKQGRLCIEDLKYGWGIVEVEENWQLLGYAVGEVIRRGQSFEHIVLRIHQPRPHHEDGWTREWILTYAELIQYKEKIEARFQEIANGRRDLQTSEKCKYCPAAGEACPAFSRLFYRALEVSRGFVQDSLTNEEIARQLDQAKRSSEALKIKIDSLQDLATMRIKRGGIIPNYVMVNKYTHRSWKPGLTPDIIKAMTGKNVSEQTFMSPAKAEKLGIDKKLIASLTTSSMSGVKLEKRNASDIGDKIFGKQKPLGGN